MVAEAAGLSGGMGAYLLRSLISEGKIRYDTVDSSNGLKPLRIEREGPTGLLITTTKLHLEAELETRLFSVPVDDTPAQTRAIMLATADESRGQKADLGPWKAFQDWLGEAERGVTDPFAHKLAKAIPPVAVRLRRDFRAILQLIKVHALLHQTNRERDADGQVVATLEDYAAVRELVADLLSEGVGASVSPTVRETVEAVRAAKLPFGVPLPRIAKALKLDKSVVSRRVSKAEDLGYLRNEEARKGRPACIVLGEPLPEEVQVLPPPEALQCCGVAGGEG